MLDCSKGDPIVGKRRAELRKFQRLANYFYYDFFIKRKSAMRNNMLEWTATERAIWEAKQAVERDAAHPLMTDATILLTQAQQKVAEYIELTAAAKENP